MYVYICIYTYIYIYIYTHKCGWLRGRQGPVQRQGEGRQHSSAREDARVYIYIYIYIVIVIFISIVIVIYIYIYSYVYIYSYILRSSSNLHPLHSPCAGAETKRTELYTPDMADATHSAIQEEALSQRATAAYLNNDNCANR